MIDVTATDGPHEFSCLMLYLPKDIGRKVIAWGEKFVPEEWLAEEGRERDPHITVKYGLHTKALKDVEPFFPNGPVEVQLGRISRFDTHPDHDVIKIDIESDELYELHERISDGLEHSDQHKEYKPHATIAYVAKGKGGQLDGQRPFDGIDLSLSDLVWSPAGEGDDRKEHVDLAKEPARAWLWTPGWMRR